MPYNLILPSRREKLKNISALLVIIISFLALLGWIAELPILKRIHSDLPEMQANTAAAMLLAGIALWLSNIERSSLFRRAISIFLSVVVFTVGAITVTEYLSSTNTGFDRLLIAETNGAGNGRFPDRMCPHSAAGLILIGASMLLLHFRRARRQISELLAVAALGVTLAAMLGHLYGAKYLYGIDRVNGMALHTAIAFCLLSVGLLLVNLESRSIEMFFSRSLGGTLFRRLLPVAIFVPVFLGWLRIVVQKYNLFDVGSGVALATLATAAAICGFVFYLCRRVHRSDIERRTAQEKLAANEQRYRALVDHGQGLICTHSLDGTITGINPAALSILGYREDEIIGRGLCDFIPPENLDQLNAYLRRIANEGIADGIFAVRPRSGPLVLWKYNNVLLTDEDVEPFVLGHAQDVTQLVKAQEALKNLSLTDDLTGQYNRRGFLTLAEQQIKLERHEGTARGLLLLFADLDGLKQINDTYGHDAGSDAIITFAAIIKSVVRDSDLVARWGGDEFVILTIGSQDKNSKSITERITEKLDEYNLQSGKPYRIECSLGSAAVITTHERSIDEIIAEADAAMYHEKRRRKASRSISPDRKLAFARVDATPEHAKFT